MSNLRRPTLQEIVNEAIAAGLRDLYTVIPAKVVKWDASTQKADCQVLIQNVTEAEDESREVASWPVITNVPVQFMGAGGYRMTVPISDGSSSTATTGSLFFCHRSLDKWLTGSGAEVDPQFDHDHALNDAIFFPGLMPFGAPWQSCPTDHMTVGSDSGQQLHFHDSTIVAGDEGSAQFVALANLVKAELDKIVTTLGTGATPVGGGTVTFGTPYSSSAVAGSVLKAKP